MAPVVNGIRPVLSIFLSNVTQVLKSTLFWIAFAIIIIKKIFFLDLDSVPTEIEAISGLITSLVNHETRINSTLDSYQTVSHNFTASCNSDMYCEATVPIISFLNSIGEVSHYYTFFKPDMYSTVKQ